MTERRCVITSCAPRSAAASLTGQAVDHRRPLLLVLLLWRGAVLSVHLADGGCAFALDLRVKLLVEQYLVHQVRLHGAGLGRGLRGPVVVAWNEERKTGTAKCTFQLTRRGFPLGLRRQMIHILVSE